MNYIIANAFIVNEGRIFKGNVFIENSVITDISESTGNNPKESDNADYKFIDASGKYLFPGIIDSHVHFREPGLTHKADINSESKAAVAGGVTSFFDMPNTVPNAVSIDVLEDKYTIASESSLANYSFYIGAANNNLDELLKLDPLKNCGVKIFLGASTGNMQVDDESVLDNIFSRIRLPLSVHCENPAIIAKNLVDFQKQYSDDIPVKCHPLIRSEEACYKSSSFAVKLAQNLMRVSMFCISLLLRKLNCSAILYLLLRNE